MSKFIYEFKEFIPCLFYQIRKLKLNISLVAKGTNIHSSYFSRALKNQANFSQSQIFKICDFLHLKEKETEYLLLLWQYHCAQLKSEKTFFYQRILTIRDSHLKVLNRIQPETKNTENLHSDISIYYKEAITALVHIYLTIPEYRKDLSKILQKIPLSKERLELALNRLEQLGIIRRKGSEIRMEQKSIHLDEDSDLSFSNHINWRLNVIQFLEQRNADSSDYHASIIFSADENIKHQLKQILREAVLNGKTMVENCDNPTNTYRLLLDLY